MLSAALKQLGNLRSGSWWYGKTDPRTERIHLNRKLVMYSGLITLGILALILRYSMLKFKSGDYTDDLSPWYDFLKTHGIQGLRINFSNYNLPYLYLLYLGTLTAIPKIVVIKGISILFDIVLASGVLLIVRRFNPRNYMPEIAALITLFLPTVFINSAMWAQSDSIYTAFVVYSFYFALDKRFTLMWILWALSFCFKLQAVFFLPVIVIVGMRYRIWWKALICIPVLILQVVPALIIGRPLSSILQIYTSQVGFYHSLTMHAANFYQWIPDSLFSFFNAAGMVITLSLIIFIGILVFYREKFSEGELVLIATLLLLVIPFFLPQMHERYFYPAEIFCLLSAFIYRPVAWYVPVVQFATLCAYTPFLFKVRPPIPLNIVALFILVLIAHLTYTLFIRGAAPLPVLAQRSRQTKTT